MGGDAIGTWPQPMRPSGYLSYTSRLRLIGQIHLVYTQCKLTIARVSELCLGCSGCLASCEKSSWEEDCIGIVVNNNLAKL
jgi:coenzyme F420-reducing hydrogenase gamma subunit